MIGSLEFHSSSDDWSTPQYCAKSEVAERVTLSTLLGGSAAIDYIVDDVIEKVVKDRFLAPYLLGVGSEELRRTQSKIIKRIAEHCSAADLIDLQEDFIEQHEALFALGVNEHHFDLILGHFVLTLESLGVTKPYIVECARLIMPLRHAVATGSAQARERQAFARNSLSV